MKQLLTTFTILIIYIAALGQTSVRPSGSLVPMKRSTTSTAIEFKKNVRSLTFYPSTYIESENFYSDSTGMSIIIQNSLPTGDLYTDPSGNKFASRICWNRVINETDKSVDFTISFPAANLELSNSFPKIGSSASSTVPSSYIHLFLPSDTMTMDKESLYNYGATGVKAFLDSNINKTTVMQRTLKPKEECLFYIGAIFQKANGTTHAELVLKNQQLFYRIQGIEAKLDAALIPCGSIVFKNN